MLPCTATRRSEERVRTAPPWPAGSSRRSSAGSSQHPSIRDHSSSLPCTVMHGPSERVRSSSAPLNQGQLGLGVVNGFRRFRDRRISNCCLEVLRLVAFEILRAELRQSCQLHAGRRRTSNTMCQLRFRRWSSPSRPLCHRSRTVPARAASTVAVVSRCRIVNGVRIEESEMMRPGKSV